MVGNSGLKLICKSLPRSIQGPLSASPMDLRHCCPSPARLSNQTQTENTVGVSHLLKSSEVLSPHNIFIFHSDETGIHLGAPPPAESRRAHKGLCSHQLHQGFFLHTPKAHTGRVYRCCWQALPAWHFPLSCPQAVILSPPQKGLWAVCHRKQPTSK